MKNLNKKSLLNKRAFTLIELLIVIAIIGILFIVLVSKVDFASDKAKASGVQTDFRSFQLAFEQVAKEHAGFNTFGWDTGDDASKTPAGYTYTNQNQDKADGKRNSYDKGDKNLNGIQDAGETFTGRKIYTEEWTGTYTLIKPGTTGYDRTALSALEASINANLDPKLQITINYDGSIVMANGAQDPWNREYHGQYYSSEDGMDRGAIFMYSDGPNNIFGSAYKLENGVATVYVPNSNKNGKDDYSMVSVYTYLNGYGEVLTATTGFSNNQNLVGNNMNVTITPNTPETPNTPDTPTLLAGIVDDDGNIITPWEELIANGTFAVNNGVLTRGTVLPDNLPEINEYGFYFDVPYCLSDDNEATIVFYADGSANIVGELVPAGTLSYSYKNIDASVLDLDMWTVSENGDMITILDGEIVCTLDLRGPDFPGGNLVLPNNSTITTIAEDLFYYCDGLTSITIPDSVTEIGYGTFNGCSSLTSVVIGDSVTSIGNSAFSYCSNLTNITIPNSVTSIGSSAFEYCTRLESIEIPNSITNIGDKAFYNCTSLTSVVIPDSIISMGSYTFEDCTSLANVSIGNGVVNIGSAVFRDCTSLSNITIPNSVTSIGKQTFYNCDGLTSMVIPDSVTNIGDYAFKDCLGLQDLTIGKGVTQLGRDVFKDCPSLKNLYYNATAIESGGRVFQSSGKYYGIKVIIGKNVTMLPNNLFTDGVGNSNFAANVVNVVFENGSVCSSIGDYAFFNCTGLKDITLPDSLIYVGKSAFSNCSLNYNLYDQAYYLGSSTNRYMLLVKAKNQLIESCKINDGTKFVASGAFSNCVKLKDVSVPNSVVYIGANAFEKCSGLTSVVIPDSVTSIGEYAFYNCSGLTSVTIGNGINNIGESAFSGCSNINKVSINDINSWFNVSLANVMSNPMANGADLYLDDKLVTSVSIPNFITVINRYLFNGCTSIKEVDIPNHVTEIDQQSFANCININDVWISDSIILIGYRVFGGCSNIACINFDGSMDQWNTIDFHDAWFDSISIYCTDGIIQSNSNE